MREENVLQLKRKREKQMANVGAASNNVVT